MSEVFPVAKLPEFLRKYFKDENISGWTLFRKFSDIVTASGGDSIFASNVQVRLVHSWRVQLEFLNRDDFIGQPLRNIFQPKMLPLIESHPLYQTLTVDRHMPPLQVIIDGCLEMFIPTFDELVRRAWQKA